MISVTGMLIQNGLTGQSPVEQLTSGLVGRALEEGSSAYHLALEVWNRI